MWGGQSWPQAGLLAGWTRWKAGPQADSPAPQGHLTYSADFGVTTLDAEPAPSLTSCALWPLLQHVTGGGFGDQPVGIGAQQEAVGDRSVGRCLHALDIRLM